MKVPTKYGIANIALMISSYNASIVVDDIDYNFKINGTHIKGSFGRINIKNIYQKIVLFDYEQSSPEIPMKYYCILILDAMIEGQTIDKLLLEILLDRLMDVMKKIKDSLDGSDKTIIFNSTDSITLKRIDKYVLVLTWQNKSCILVHGKITDSDEFNINECVYLFNIYFPIVINIIMNNDEINLTNDPGTVLHQLLYDNMGKQMKRAN